MDPAASENTVKISYGYTCIVVCVGGLAFNFPRKNARLSKRSFLKNILCNWSEFWFYLTTRNPFVWPTYFSFFGLCNIQKIAKLPPDEDGPHIMLAMLCEIGKIGDLHTVTHADNFVISPAGKLYVHDDYASNDFQTTLREHGKTFAQMFSNYNEAIAAEKERTKNHVFY